MGISFKVSKAGTRYRSKQVVVSGNNGEEEDFVGEGKNSYRFGRDGTESVSKRGNEISEGEEDAIGFLDHEVSFSLCLYPDGYTIGKASEVDLRHQNSAEVPKSLHPYDRSAESLFSAIESGRLPGDILDDIPCKYINGMLVCEVRDYRKCFTETGAFSPLASDSAIINKVRLKMSLENVVKDIPLISDNSWTYGDLMEVESRIVKAVQPKLCLDPTPKLDRLSNNPTPNKVNLALSIMRKRSRKIAEVTTAPSSNLRGKKVCIERVPESSRLVDPGNILQQSPLENVQSKSNGQNSMLVQRNNSFSSNTSGPASPLVAHPSKYQMGLGSPILAQDNRLGSVLHPGGSLGPDMINYPETMNTNAVSFHGKRDSQEAQSSSPSLSNSSKRYRMVVDGSQQQHVASHVEGFHGSESQWKNMPLARGLQYGNPVMQKYPQQLPEGGSNQAGSMNLAQGLRYSLKEEPADSGRLEKLEIPRSKSSMHLMESELNHVDSQKSRLQQNVPAVPQTHWSNMGQSIEGSSRKEDLYQKRKVVHSPRVSAGGLPQSPLSSKSGEFSSGSVGPQVGAAVTSGFFSSQKERSVVTSVPQIGVSTSLTSSANDSMQRQHQAQIAAKRRSNSLPRTPAMSGVGSPVSVSNAGINVSSPPVGTSSLADPVMERLSKIDVVTMRYQLNSKRNKVDQPFRKPKVFPSQDLHHHLSSDSRNENFKDDSCTMPLSKSLVGGSINVCKARVLNFMLSERVIQGNSFSVVPKARMRLIMSEKPNDGAVAMHIGEIEDAQYLATEDYLPTLPNTHTADLLAAQFCSLMIREGYQVEDHVQPKPVTMAHSSSSQPNTPGVPPNNVMAEIQQPSQGTSQPAGDMTKPSNSSSMSVNQSQNQPGTGILPSGNFQGSQMSQGFLQGVAMPSRSQQLDPLSSLLQPQQQQQPLVHGQQPMMQSQHSQFQRSAMMLGANPMSNLNSLGHNTNMQLGGHMGNKPSPLQLQMLQQQQQQSQQQQQQQQQLQQQQQQQQLQQQQLQRKMMMGLGTVGMGNMANNMVGLGGLNNVMGMAGARGMGVSGMSAPLASIGGMGNMGQNSMNLGQASNISNITQQYRSGAITPAQAALMATRLKMAQQSRGNMMGGPQSAIGAMTGSRQAHPGSSGLSMLGPALNRGNINPMQRAVGQMGPPKLMAGMNAYMNQQQQQQLQQQQQQQLQLQQQQLQLQQQQQQFQQQQLQQQSESNSPLQSIVSSPLVGSPSNMGLPQQINQQSQQQASPQQMSQRTPMSPQLSSGAMHTISAGNPEAGPASPQLSSSQTLGSVANSPMELQNKNNSAS